jgi:hypothetical protein
MLPIVPPEPDSSARSHRGDAPKRDGRKRREPLHLPDKEVVAADRAAAAAAGQRSAVGAQRVALAQNPAHCHAHTTPRHEPESA